MCEFQEGDRVELTGKHLPKPLRGYEGTVIPGNDPVLVLVRFDENLPKYGYRQYIRPQHLTNLTQRNE